MYIHGVTDPSSWASELKNPAPWGEIGSSKVVFATPTSSLRTQPDAAAVMDQWDQVRGVWVQLVGVGQGGCSSNRQLRLQTCTFEAGKQ